MKRVKRKVLWRGEGIEFIETTREYDVKYTMEKDDEDDYGNPCLYIIRFPPEILGSFHEFLNRHFSKEAEAQQEK